MALAVRDGALAPRAWRISTPDGVFWLVEDGSAARLVRLPMPGSAEELVTLDEDEPWAALTALASSAETAASGRWVRGGLADPTDLRAGGVADDPP